jgi:hypothetical protein
MLLLCYMILVVRYSVKLPKRQTFSFIKEQSLYNALRLIMHIIVSLKVSYFSKLQDFILSLCYKSSV